MATKSSNLSGYQRIIHDLVKSVSDKSNGLALLIGCSTTNDPQCKPLEGVKNDIDTLRETFSTLNFTVLCLLDEKVEIIKDVIKIISNLEIQHCQGWRRLVVTFSGHGDKDHLHAMDGKLKFKEDIFGPLISTGENFLVGMAKLFFIDACRGSNEDWGIDLSSLSSYAARGQSGHVLQDSKYSLRPSRQRVLLTGNYLVAYSTLSGMKAYELNGHGCWMQVLCEKLLDPSLIQSSIGDVLVEVNSHLLSFLNECGKDLQQPVVKNTLNETVKLLEEAQGLGPGQRRATNAKPNAKPLNETTDPKPSKTPKMMLKEYCDKKFKGKRYAKYETWEVEGGFQSRVDCFGHGYVTGSVKRRKQEAETSAAIEALKILDS